MGTALPVGRAKHPARRRGTRVGLVTMVLVAGLGLSFCAATGSRDEIPAHHGAGTPSTLSTHSAPRTWTEPGASASPAPAPTAAPGAVTVTQALEQIPTKGRAPKTGYARKEFGRGWKDPDRNGCDARNDILGRDLSQKTYKPGTRECVVLTGTLADPYTGSSISFLRGSSTSTAVQIDHVVALSDAWQKGAQQLDADTRLKLANDPLNLMAVDGPTNSRKSDGDAATWLPPLKSFRCEYVARQSAVKLKYGLWMTRAEKAAVTRVVAACPGQVIPAG